MNEDHYAHRFYWHSKEDPGNDPLVSKTISRIKRTFQWRKEVDPAGEELLCTYICVSVFTYHLGQRFLTKKAKFRFNIIAANFNVFCKGIDVFAKTSCIFSEELCVFFKLNAPQTKTEGGCSFRYVDVLYNVLMDVLCPMAGIKPSDISPILKEKGNLYLYKKDCDGKPLLVMCMKRHYKGIDSMDNMKKLIHFYMEKVDRLVDGRFFLAHLS